jgi:hypothetical protein
VLGQAWIRRLVFTEGGRCGLSSRVTSSYGAPGESLRRGRSDGGRWETDSVSSALTVPLLYTPLTTLTVNLLLATASLCTVLMYTVAIVLT